jgi:hypothetical protein
MQGVSAEWKYPGWEFRGMDKWRRFFSTFSHIANINSSASSSIEQPRPASSRKSSNFGHVKYFSPQELEPIVSTFFMLKGYNLRN